MVTEARAWPVGYKAFGDLDTTHGTWTSRWHEPGFAFTHLVPSWAAHTPAGTWLEIGLQVRTARAESKWFNAGTWVFDDGTVQRRSVRDDRDSVGCFDVDTFTANNTAPGDTPIAFRMRVTLHSTDSAQPTLRHVAATTATPGSAPTVPSTPSLDDDVELDVSGLSQVSHSGTYSEFGGGGQVWCSPTSVAMIMQFWGVHPGDDEFTQLPADATFDANGRRDPQVPWAAIHTWDYGYQGCGNWPFSTAYASHYGLDGSVRYCSSLHDVEQWIASGVPVVISIRWDNNADDPLHRLDGAGVEHSNGHLLVVAGFTTNGDVIVYDPAAPGNDHVRRVYRRDQFEHNWLRGSHGITYIIKPSET